ncbi:uncharacterized protein LOC132200658 [Neocloeon triangulifer]|uniref:uncharacterized protein LOC132200658 n=1 Tax=Neocloeon triangulifer TaxID=2078957 RepID=UPI00286EB5C1|nr:uncharacterized protein LOC132200658 [Neocloeon triangulifer]
MHGKIVLSLILCFSAVLGDGEPKFSGGTTLCEAREPFFRDVESDAKIWMETREPPPAKIQFDESGSFSYKSVALMGVGEAPPYSGYLTGTTPILMLESGDDKVISRGTLLAASGGSFELRGETLSISVDAHMSVVKVRFDMQGQVQINSEIVGHVQDLTLTALSQIQVVQTKGKVILHDLGLPGQFSVTISGMEEDCVVVNYFSKQDVNVELDKSMTALPASSVWTEHKIMTAGTTTLTFHVSKGHDFDFGLANIFLPCSEVPARATSTKSSCLGSPDVLRGNDCPDGLYGRKCDKQCEEDWIVCDTKGCYCCSKEQCSVQTEEGGTVGKAFTGLGGAIICCGILAGAYKGHKELQKRGLYRVRGSTEEEDTGGAESSSVSETRSETSDESSVSSDGELSNSSVATSTVVDMHDPDLLTEDEEPKPSDYCMLM